LLSVISPGAIWHHIDTSRYRPFSVFCIELLLRQRPCACACGRASVRACGRTWVSVSVGVRVWVGGCACMCVSALYLCA
jgi:hypothetical protein